MSKYAPIALFVYKRPGHVRRTIDALKQCPEFEQSPLYVFCDGAKSEADIKDVMDARKVAHDALSGHAEFRESEKNRGLARSIIDGVTRLCSSYGRVIVIEDDLKVRPGILTYMNSALNKYEAEDSVMQVSAFMFPVTNSNNSSTSLFLPFVSSWGWATWDRAWRYFDEDASGSEILDDDLSMRHRFNVNGSYDYFRMLKLQKTGKVDSWAIRWYWSVFRRGGLVLYPPQTLVENTGFDGSGTHTSRTAHHFVTDNETHKNFDFPKQIKVKDDDLVAVEKILAKTLPNPFFRLIRDVLSRLRNFKSK